MSNPSSPSRLGSSFPRIPKALKWNCGIYISSTGLKLWIEFSINSLRVSFSVASSSGITFLARAVMLFSSTLTFERIDCETSQRNVCVWGKELGLLFYASPLSISLSFTFLKLYISREVVQKSTRDNPERYLGGRGGWVYCSSKKFDRMAREAVEVCLRMLKENSNRRFDSYSVKNSVLIISHLPFRIVAYTFFLTTFLEITVNSPP